MDGGGRRRRVAPVPISSATIRSSRSIAISSTSVPGAGRQPGQSMPASAGRPGSRWPDTTVKSAATPRWVSGMPAAAGAASAELMPGHHRHRHAGRDAGEELLAAAAEDERVAALEPDHPLARPGPGRRASR